MIRSKVRSASRRLLATFGADSRSGRHASSGGSSIGTDCEDIFERMPVAVWLQDYSTVGSWLDALREAGIDDLRTYFSEYPNEVDHCVGLIRLLDVNRAALELVGAAGKEDVMAVSLEAELTDESRKSFVEQFVAIWEGRGRIEIEFVGRTLSGEEFPCLLRGSMCSPTGELDLSRVVVSIIDITERKAAEVRLEELVRSKDELIASVSHEIRTPLTSIIGSSQLLYSEGARLSDAEKDEMFQILVRQSADVANIVDDLIVAAKADIGKLQVMSMPVDVYAQATQVIETWDRRAVDHIPLAGESVWCVGDPNRVRQIVRNLISNALHHGGERVRVFVESDATTAHVRVIDDGPGIPMEDRERIFENYQRGTPIPGLTSAIGLGLGISRYLAHLMGGDLTYRFEEGESIFELSLPLSETDSDACNDMSDS
ncbi:hypothetical protein MNBD_ACTINO01-377 [hydrothermal vent metagenome]|uniref:histidine kinase n=1 Tax=hydrothermal vent metagenome TaxID=652676 RepID=A0A3B0SIL9_9ZZZZ